MKNQKPCLRFPTNCPLGRFLKGQFQLQCGIGAMARPGSNPVNPRNPLRATRQTALIHKRVRLRAHKKASAQTTAQLKCSAIILKLNTRNDGRPHTTHSFAHHFCPYHQPPNSDKVEIVKRSKECNDEENTEKPPTRTSGNHL